MNRDLLRRQVVLRADLGGELQHADEHRRHPLAVRHAVLLDERQRVLGRELLHHDGGAAEPQRAHAVEERCRVIQRRGRQVDGVGSHSPDRGHHAHLGRLLADSLTGDLVLDAFGPSRRARRIEHPRAFELFRERLGRIAVARHLVRVVAVDRMVADDEPHLGVRHLVEQLNRDRGERVADDEYLRVAIVDDVRGLVTVEVPVDARVEEPGPLRGPTHLEELRAVLHQHRDVIAEPQPGIPEQLRQLIRAVVQLPVRKHRPGRAHDNSRMRRPFRRVPTGPHLLSLPSPKKGQVRRRARAGRGAGNGHAQATCQASEARLAGAEAWSLPAANRASERSNNRTNDFARLHSPKRVVHIVQLDRPRHHRARVQPSRLDQVDEPLEVAAHLA